MLNAPFSKRNVLQNRTLIKTSSCLIHYYPKKYFVNFLSVLFTCSMDLTKFETEKFTNKCYKRESGNLIKSASAKLWQILLRATL